MIKIKIWELVFKKKYIEWDEYQEKIKTIDKMNFKKSIELENKRVNEEDMNYSS